MAQERHLNFIVAEIFYIMNARSHIFELSVEPWQVEESLLSIFHPILFHRLDQDPPSLSLIITVMFLSQDHREVHLPAGE